MKNIFLFLFLLSILFSNAQVVNIPDTGFKEALLVASPTEHVAQDVNYNWITVDVNDDFEIQESEALAVYHLVVDHKFIENVAGIDKFTNLVTLNCNFNSISNINLEFNLNLNTLYIESNNLTSIDVASNTNLLYLSCRENSLTALELSNNASLNYLNCSGNDLASLDISTNTVLTELFCGYNNLNAIDVSLNTILEKLDCTQNNLSLLNLSTNTDLNILSCGSNSLSNLDLSLNTNLTNLSCKLNNITNLDVSQLSNLISLNCENNNLSAIDISNNNELRYFLCSSNNLSNLDVNSNSFLSNLSCASNSLLKLDLSENMMLTQLKCGNNNSLDYINLKNGNNDNFIFGEFSDFEVLPNINTICVDELNSDLTAFISTEAGIVINYTEYCSLSPVNYNEIYGKVKFDSNLDGCDVTDTNVPNKLVVTDNGSESFATFTQDYGDYLIYTNEGNFTTEFSLNRPSYIDATPSDFTNTFTGFNNTFEANFCTIPTQSENDLTVSLVPLNQVRTGLSAFYQIVYTNNGTSSISGSLDLNFDSTKLSFVSANPSENTNSGSTISFNFDSLNPFETRAIDLEFQVFAPPVVNLGDELQYNVSITPLSGDYTLNDNTYVLSQTIVDSYDPNDIHILEGSEIMYADKEKSLHYVIRFQNTGTADAINVVVKNVLDTNLDWTTIELETTSHPSRVAITNGRKVEFIFENIYLPDSTTDEQGSHGFIAYKVKAKPDVAVNDIIPNKADIFFDLNAPIETNTAITKFVTTLGVKEENKLIFNVYPIPAKGVLQIKSSNTIAKIEIYTKIGQLVITDFNVDSVDVSNLVDGVYFCKITDLKDNVEVKKIIKK